MPSGFSPVRKGGTTSHCMEMRRFTRAELRQYDGRGGARALVGLDGKVYDVSSSFHWQKGRHQVLHDAGRDLTAVLREAPHGADLLYRFPIVGTVDPE